MAAPLSQLPWTMAQEEFGVAGADFLGSMGRLLVKHAKDEIRSQVRGATGEFGKTGPAGAKDEISEVWGGRGALSEARPKTHLNRLRSPATETFCSQACLPVK